MPVVFALSVSASTTTVVIPEPQIRDMPVIEQNSQPEAVLAQPDPIANNCYLYIKSLIPNLPFSSEIKPNEDYPSVAGITILKYGEVIHYVKNIKITAEGLWEKESNYIKGEFTTRLLDWKYLSEHQAEYWRPTD